MRELFCRQSEAVPLTDSDDLETICGQGHMLGPGIGEVAARAITGTGLDGDEIILK